MPARRLNPGFQGGGDGMVMRPGKMKDAMVRALQSGALSLAGRGLVVLPDEFQTLDALEYDNKTWWQEADVTKLDLSNNKLTALPQNIAELPMLGALQVVSIADNELAALPASLFRLPHLNKLYAMRNRLETLPEDVGAAMALQEADLSENPLTSLPPSFGNLHNLGTLKITGTQLTALPESMGGCSGLHTLDLSSNRLTHLPESMVLLNKLQHIELACNKIRVFPVFSPTAPITRLCLRQNQLCGKIDVCGLAALKDLVLSFNALSSLWIVGSDGLATVDVRDNQLSDVTWALELARLKHLNVANNNLSGLPPGLAGLTDLATLNLEGNPIRSIRREVLMKGCAEILKYLKSRDTADTGPTAADAARETKASALVARNHYDLSRKPHTAQLARLPPDAFQNITSEDGPGITTFKCNGHLLDCVPEEIGLCLPSLVTLELNENKIAAPLPVSFARLGRSLASLSLKRNNIPVCPRLEVVPMLTYLDLGVNRIRGTVDVRCLERLDTLVLSDNGLSDFPLLPPSLSVLTVGGNRLEALPNDLPTALPKLSSLDATNNNLATIPPNIGTMSHMRSLLLHGNPLKTVRRAMLDKGTDALLAYLRDKMEGGHVAPPAQSQQLQHAGHMAYQQPPQQQQQQQQHYGGHGMQPMQQQQQQHEARMADQQPPQQQGHVRGPPQQQPQPARAARRGPAAPGRSGGGQSSIQFF